MGYLLILGIILLILWYPIGVLINIWSNELLVKKGLPREPSPAVVILWPIFLLMLVLNIGEQLIIRASWLQLMMFLTIFVLVMMFLTGNLL